MSSTRISSSPCATMSPIRLRRVTLPSLGARRILSADLPPMSPGAPVSGRADPSLMMRPSSWPRIVSMTASTSRPAEKPGPRAITTAPSTRAVPVFVFAMMPSTMTSARTLSRITARGSTTTATRPDSTTDGQLSASARSARSPSTTWLPRYTASAKETVSRMAAGCGQLCHDDAEAGRVKRQGAAGGEVSRALDDGNEIAIRPSPGMG